MVKYDKGSLYRPSKIARQILLWLKVTGIEENPYYRKF